MRTSLGWTFEVSASDITHYPLGAVTGLVLPEEKTDRAGRSSPIVAKQILPEKFDWREESGLTPVKFQGGCGSCWAFATIGAVASSIMIADGIDAELSDNVHVHVHCGACMRDYALEFDDPRRFV